VHDHGDLPPAYRVLRGLELLEVLAALGGAVGVAEGTEGAGCGFDKAGSHVVAVRGEDDADVRVAAGFTRPQAEFEGDLRDAVGEELCRHLVPEVVDAYAEAVAPAGEAAAGV